MLYLVLSLDLFMIADLSSFVTKGLSFPLTYFNGACLSSNVRTRLVRMSYLSTLSLSKSLLKSIDPNS